MLLEHFVANSVKDVVQKEAIEYKFQQDEITGSITQVGDNVVEFPRLG